MNRVTTEPVQDEHYDKRRQRGQNRTAQRLRDTRVDHFGRNLSPLSTNFTNPVKHDNRIVQRVTNHGQQSCLLYTSPSPRDKRQSRMPSSA